MNAEGQMPNAEPMPNDPMVEWGMPMLCLSIVIGHWVIESAFGIRHSALASCPLTHRLALRTRIP